jgi:DNA-binding transcriptional MerR regulator
MKIKNIREILAQLSRELQRAEDVDIDARQKLQDLHRHVDELDEAQAPELGSLWDRAKELESRFAAAHPTLERMARELADAIAKMGV